MTKKVKKAGTTQITDQEGTHKGEIQGVLPVTTALVRYSDSQGREDVRLAIVIPGGGVHFFHSNASGSIDLRLSPRWLGEAIHQHLKEIGPDRLTTDTSVTVNPLVDDKTVQV